MGYYMILPFVNQTWQLNIRQKLDFRPWKFGDEVNPMVDVEWVQIRLSRRSRI